MRRLIMLTAVLACAGGAFAPALAQKTAPAVTRDSDHDGVPDTRDRCRNTPANTRVDERGCPAAAAPAAAPTAQAPSAAPAAPTPAAAAPQNVAAAPAGAPGQQGAVIAPAGAARPPTGPPAAAPAQPQAHPVAADTAHPVGAQAAGGGKPDRRPPSGLPAPAGAAPGAAGQPGAQQQAQAAPAGQAAAPAGAAQQQAAAPTAPAGQAQPSQQQAAGQQAAPPAGAPSGAAAQVSVPVPSAPRPAAPEPERQAQPAAAPAPAAAGFSVEPYAGASAAELAAYSRHFTQRLDSAVIALVDIFRNTSGAPLAGASGPSVLSSRERGRWSRCRVLYFDLQSYSDAVAVLQDSLSANADAQRAAAGLAQALDSLQALAECDNIGSMIEAPDRWSPWQRNYETSARNFYRTWYPQVRVVHEADRAFARALNAALPAGHRIPDIPGLPPNPPYFTGGPR